MVDIRYTRGLDELCLYEWTKDPKVKQLLVCEGEEEARIFCRTWMHFAGKKAGLSAVVQDVNVGMGVIILMPYQKVMHHATIQILVSPEHARKGVGSVLLKNLIHLAKNYLKLEVLFLELLGPSPYTDFFLSRGFKTYAIQKDYVEGVYPDKILLEYSLL